MRIALACASTCKRSTFAQVTHENRQGGVQSQDIMRSHLNVHLDVHLLCLHMWHLVLKCNWGRVRIDHIIHWNVGY